MHHVWASSWCTMHHPPLSKWCLMHHFDHSVVHDAPHPAARREGGPGRWTDPPPSRGPPPPWVNQSKSVLLGFGADLWVDTLDAFASQGPKVDDAVGWPERGDRLEGAGTSPGSVPRPLDSRNENQTGVVSMGQGGGR